jgi:hypothetical protein
VGLNESSLDGFVFRFLTANRALFYGVGMKSAKILLFPVLALIIAGCAGYRVGSTLDKSIKTVSLTVINKTDEPSVEVAVMKALRAELQMDGRLEVRPQNEADVVLSVTLSKFEQNPLAFNRKQGSLAAEYRVTLSGKAVLCDAESNKVILETPSFQGESEFPYEADLTTTKRAALPEAASDLARKVVSLVVTSW